MSGYQIPDDLDEQTRQLVEAGVAEKLMRFLPSQRANARGATLDACKFWARWTTDDEGRPTRQPWLQVVVRYPTNRENDPHPFYGCAITVAAEGPWFLAEQETLDTDQLVLVEQLAGPRP